MRMTSRILFLALALVWVGAGQLAAQHPWSGLAPATQISLAVQAAPAEMRDGARIHGYAASGALVTLREGTNDLICMAPNPASEQLEVSCHHVGLEPFIARGRELAAQGVTGQDRAMARWKEYEEGKLPIPYGAVNYIMTATGLDAAAGTLEGAHLRWVIYTPMATAATTGITERPVPGGPWLMAPGTPGSHIMITPPAPPRGGGE